jgi:GNAT superfamily N-acetyltransferase
MQEKYEIKPADSGKTLKDFINFPYLLYKDNSYWIPPIKSGEKKLWTKHPALKFVDLQKWVVYWKGRPVGRIGAAVNRKYNEKTQTRYGRIVGLEMYNDEKAFRLLMDTATAWLKEKGMEKVHGPLGFTNLDTQGMLIEGFDQIPSIASVYHLPYYKTLMKKYGFEKENDWVEFHLKLTDEPVNKGERGAKLLKRRFGFEVFSPQSKSELKKYAKTAFDILNHAFAHLPYVIELDDELKNYYENKYFDVLDPKFTFFVKDKDKIVGFLIAIPSLSKGMKKAGGKLFPFGWYYILQSFKHPDCIDTLLTGVIPEYDSKGVAVMLFDALHKAMKANGIIDIETTGVFENNHNVISNWKNYEHIQHKRRRTWIKDL